MHRKAEVTRDFAAEIGERVLRERKRLGLRQDELGLAAGVSTRVVHQIEHGKTTSRLDSLAPVLDVLGLTLAVQETAGSAGDGDAR